jgi:uncharacterized protein
MQISMYQASVPVFIRMMTNLVAILEKAAAHAESRKIDPSVLVNARLFPDMFPLGRQVQIAADTAKAGPARLAGLQPPSFEDTETTFPQLIERVRKTVAFLETLTPEQIDGTEERSVTWPARGSTRRQAGLPGSDPQVSNAAFGAARRHADCSSIGSVCESTTPRAP